MPNPNATAQKILLITGHAGAGRSTVLRALEDLGFETIDNLPMSLLPRLLGGLTLPRPMAIGLDTRNRDFDAGGVLAIYDELQARDDLEPELVFLDCERSVLLRRYSETRRRHPLAETGSPREGIQRDVDLISPLRDAADVLIDTSYLTVHDLRAQIDKLYAPTSGRFLAVQVQSYSYKRGIPQGLDIALDVRFLRNPHWEPSLRSLTGRDAEVAAYVAQDPRYDEFFTRSAELIGFLLPAYRDEGKAHLSIGFGCTGGQHRSVTLAEAMAKHLAQEGWHVSMRHRELDRSGKIAAPAGMKTS